jgi:hypothetical protein
MVTQEMKQLDRANIKAIKRQVVKYKSFLAELYGFVVTNQAIPVEKGLELALN